MIKTIINGVTADLAMDEIAASVFGAKTLDGSLTYMGSPHFTARQVLVSAGHSEDLGFEVWEYYSKEILGVPSGTLKAWLRWNGQLFDAYLQAQQDTKGILGFASHDTPYIDYS